MTRGIIATPHRAASEAGAQVLRDGGNAVDAAIAANAVLCVVYPHMTSIGGDLMAIVWPAGASAPIGLIGAGRSGELASIEAVRERGYDAMPERGVLSVTVPGTVEAWARLLERFGTVGFAVVLEPAAALAQDGYVITPSLSEFLKGAAEILGREQAAYSLYPPMDAGMLLRNPDLASVLRDMGRYGINSFYRGEVAHAIAAAIDRRGGFVTARDLATHYSRWVDTLTVGYRDVVVHELPPPTQGVIAIELLRILNATPPAKPGAEFVELWQKACGGVRALRDQIRDGGDTVYLCAADEHGNYVSLIQSVAFDFGSGIVAEGTGIVLQNRGSYFSLDPNHANRLEPKKITRHTLIPAMATRDGRPWALYGSMGGDGQPQLQTQVLVNLIDHDLDPQEAVARPRIRITPDGGTTTVEASYPGAGELARTRPDVMLLPPGHHTVGHAQAIVIDGPGEWRAGADPRADGSVETAR